MKRKTKIITTIASLCLAVALMAFGVYAATQVTLSITSKVSFEVTDVFATITGAFEVNSGAAGAFDIAATNTYYDADSTGAATFTYVTYNGTKGGSDMEAKTIVDPDAQTWYTGIAKYTSGVKKARIVIMVTNDAASGQDSIYVKIGALITADTNGYTSVTNKWGVTDSSATADTAATAYTNDVEKYVKVAPGSTAVFVLERTLLNTSVNIDGMDMVDGDSTATALVVTAIHDLGVTESASNLLNYSSGE